MNDVGFHTEFYECDCQSDEHTLKFSLDMWEEGGPDIHASVFLNDFIPWWKRIWIAIKYVFGYKCRYGHWDTFLMRKEDHDRFIQLINMAKEINSLRSLEYKGFKGHAKFDLKARIWHGDIENCGRDVVTFQGSTPSEVKKAFEDSVNDYLEFKNGQLQ